jgi:hypothetical protein
MRIVELGTFLLPKRLSLTRLLGGDRDAVAAAIAAEFSEFASAPPLRSDGLLIDFHRSLGARQMETMLFEGALDTPDLGLVRLYFSSLSVGFVVTEIDIPDGVVVDLDTGAGQDDFKTLESALTAKVSPLVKQWCDRVEHAIRPECTQDRPSSAMPAGTLLWWHRISVDPPADSEFSAPRFFGVSVELGDTVRCAVGNGFTNICGQPGPLVEHVVEGIMVATQEWLIVDEAQRLLADHLVRLSQTRTGDLISVDSQYAELLLLTQEVTLRKLILSEEQRYLANTRTKVKDAATECWRLDNQTADLEGRITALRDLFMLHRERITNDRDERRNRLVFVITAITLVQSVLVWYDFLTEPNNVVSADPRPTIAYLVLTLTAVAFAGTLWQQLMHRRRVQAIERRTARSAGQPPRQRTPTGQPAEANRTAAHKEGG